MAALNILSQPPNPWQLTTASTQPSICKYNNNINTVCQKYASVSNSICKCGRTTATAKSKLPTPQMFPQRTHLSGSGCSWIQDNSPFFDNVTTNGRTRGPLLSVFPTTPAQVSSVQDLFEFICTGDDIPPLVIGFSAPQGCGKTTLVFALDFLFRMTGRNSATISIDDFYLTAEDQARLRDSNPSNALLEFRGNAGSHDLSLSIETLTALGKLTKEGMKIKLPRYDKSAYNGRGNRVDPSMWPEVEGPLTVILFEGWMLGFKPLLTEAVKAVDPQLETVNKKLEAYYDAWDKFINSWIVIKIQDPSCVYQWQLQAEIAMRTDGKPGMSDEEVMDFVSRYLPAYKAYLPTLYLEGPNGSNPKHLLVVEIDEGRNPILGN
ncbi:unnamed protein product [Fraxinus pennsylvanica]|uniref:D-glycerate 3-kinase, chloroplastic n=1 Tax=Fraxinus pennsylvanica TaxID=56036 RepID=A0AAD2E1G0_9LAMI|nr:unnamed protein product [Fraxinus pennsylvanica]